MLLRIDIYGHLLNSESAAENGEILVGLRAEVPSACAKLGGSLHVVRE